eukprot:4328509-Amphidinium_carterae.3
MRVSCDEDFQAGKASLDEVNRLVSTWKEFVAGAGPDERFRGAATNLTAVAEAFLGTAHGKKDASLAGVVGSVLKMLNQTIDDASLKKKLDPLSKGVQVLEAYLELHAQSTAPAWNLDLGSRAFAQLCSALDALEACANDRKVLLTLCKEAKTLQTATQGRVSATLKKSLTTAVQGATGLGQGGAEGESWKKDLSARSSFEEVVKAASNLMDDKFAEALSSKWKEALQDL